MGYGVVVDDTWIVQSHHGPFDPESALRPGDAEEGKGKSFDHWDLVKERNGISHAELLAELRFKQDADGDGLRNFVVSGGKTSGVKTTTGRGDMESLVEESEMAGVIWEDTNED